MRHSEEKEDDAKDFAGDLSPTEPFVCIPRVSSAAGPPSSASSAAGDHRRMAAEQQCSLDAEGETVVVPTTPTGGGAKRPVEMEAQSPSKTTPRESDPSNGDLMDYMRPMFQRPRRKICAPLL